LSIWPIYIPRDKDSVKKEIERLAMAKGIPRNRLLIFILEDYLLNNRRYVDRKITDFEVQSVEQVKKEIPVYCPECFSVDVDEEGYTIHDKACGWIRMDE